MLILAFKGLIYNIGVEPLYNQVAAYFALNWTYR